MHECSHIHIYISRSTLIGAHETSILKKIHTYAHIYTDSAQLVLKHEHLQHTATHCNTTERKRERLSLTSDRYTSGYSCRHVCEFGGYFFFCVCEWWNILKPFLDLAAQKKNIYIHTNSQTLYFVVAPLFWFAATQTTCIHVYTNIHVCVIVYVCI